MGRGARGGPWLASYPLRSGMGRSAAIAGAGVAVEDVRDFLAAHGIEPEEN